MSDASNDPPSDLENVEPTAMVLRTLFSGQKSGQGFTASPVEDVAVDWQTTGASASMAEIHTTTSGAPQGRGTELIGRVAAAGEQLGLAGTCLLEAQRWETTDRKAERGGNMATRALAEMTGYYAMSAGHGLINVTLRTLLLSPTSRAEVETEYRRANRFQPFSTIPAAWLFFNNDGVEKLRHAVAAVNEGSVTQWFDIVAALESDPRWRALISRRHDDFHRWRPQSIGGGVAPENPWQSIPGGGSSLTVYGHNQYKPLDPVVLVEEANEGLQALGEAMGHWIALWPAALKGLGCPIFMVS